MTASTIILSTINILNIVAVITVIFFQRKESSTRFAWLLVLVFIPVGGFLLYLLFGHDYTRRERLSSSEEAMREVSVYVEEQLEDTANFNLGDERYVQLARMNLVNNEAVLTHDNALRVFTKGADKFEALLEDIRGARSYIHLLYYIFRTDSLGKKLLEALAEKAAQGVDVTLVYDDVGNLTISSKAFEILRRAGGKVYRYSPLFTGMISANYRNHRKLAIIDGRVGYLGGMNVGNEYVHGKDKLTPWRDTHLRIEGSAVQIMELVFLGDYMYALKRKERSSDIDMREFFNIPYEFSGKSTVQILTSAPKAGGDYIHNAYTKIISSAEQYLYIQSPYMVPGRTVLDCLRIALAAGVDVRIMLPAVPDKTFVYLATLDYARQLARLGAKIYLHQGFIHAKTMLADDQVLSVGSANLDVRSFYLSYEANAIIYDREIVVQQKEQFLRDQENSRLVDEDYFRQMSLPLKALTPVCQLFSPLL